MLITGNLPFKTEVASVFIFGQIESDRMTSAAAVSVVLLVISLVVLLGIIAVHRAGGRGMTLASQARRCAPSRSATSSCCSRRRSG